MADTSPAPAPGSPAFTIDMTSQLDVAYWCQIFDISPEQLREAVQKAGHEAVAVARYLRGKR